MPVKITASSVWFVNKDFVFLVFVFVSMFSFKNEHILGIVKCKYANINYDDYTETHYLVHAAHEALRLFSGSMSSCRLLIPVVS